MGFKDLIETEKLDPKLCPLRQSHTGRHRDRTPTDSWLIWGNQVFPLQLLGTPAVPVCRG